MWWAAVIFYTSSQSSSDQDVKPMMGDVIAVEWMRPLVSWISFSYHGRERSVAELGLEPFLEFMIRKSAHFGVYFLLALLIYWAISKTVSIRKRNLVIMTFLLTVHFATVDELNQSFTPERTPYIFDVLIDAAGALAALLCVIGWSFWKKRRGRG